MTITKQARNSKKIDIKKSAKIAKQHKGPTFQKKKNYTIKEDQTIISMKRREFSIN